MSKFDEINVGAVVEYKGKNTEKGVMLIVGVFYDEDINDFTFTGFSTRAIPNATKAGEYVLHIPSVDKDNNFTLNIYDKVEEISKGYEDEIIRIIGYLDYTKLVEAIACITNMRNYNITNDVEFTLFPKIGEVYSIFDNDIFIVVEPTNFSDNRLNVVHGYFYERTSKTHLFEPVDISLAKFQDKNNNVKLIDTLPNPECLVLFYNNCTSFRYNPYPSIRPQDIVDKINDVIKSN